MGLYTQQVIAKIIEDDPGFENHILELEKIYSAVENEEIDRHIIKYKLHY